MPNDIHRSTDAHADGKTREDDDEPIPAASEDKVLEETVRLAREGRRKLESDPKEHPTPPE